MEQFFVPEYPRTELSFLEQRSKGSETTAKEIAVVLKTLSAFP